MIVKGRDVRMACMFFAGETGDRPREGRGEEKGGVEERKYIK